jgi:serine/threonine-protein kinase HipA
MTTPIWIWLPSACAPVLAATLELGNGQGRLRYEAAYMEMAAALPLDPVVLRFSRKAAGVPIGKNGGFPGVIMDAMPAGYGADRLHARNERELSPLELLELGPPDAVGAIEVCCDIERKLEWRPHALDELRQRMEELEDSAPSSRAVRRLDDDGMTSAGGERPKVTLHHDGRLWLAKLQDRGDAPYMPAREFTVMQMARELDLQVPDILLERHGEREVFLIERFDRCGDPLQPQRHLFASAHTVLGLEAATQRGDPRRSYLVLADEMRRWISDEAALQQDLQELWRRMAYNALVGNGDDHPRNHGLIHDGAGWRLSKAFDITPLPTFVGILAMSVSADGSQEASVLNLLGACAHFGVDLREAATWLGDAAAHVANGWEAGLRAAGVPAGHTAQFAPAFRLAAGLAEDSDQLDEAASAIGRQGRGGRRRSRLG